ncbi:MAG TPA: hypothetical protein VGM91_04170 [Conexibacter sp.]|jgi:hypothetical protein
MKLHDLGLVAAEWEANVLPRERIPALATELMLAGNDTPSLRAAAGLLSTELDAAHEVFGRALAELGYERERDSRGRGRALAREYAHRGLDGRMPLVEAVDRIYKLSLDFDHEAWALSGESLTTFVVLADLWVDEPRKRPELEGDMREQLQSLLRRL